jgi:hypothetical protein
VVDFVAEIQSGKPGISHNNFEAPALQGGVARQVEVPRNSVDFYEPEQLTSFLVHQRVNCLVFVNRGDF